MAQIGVSDYIFDWNTISTSLTCSQNFFERLSMVSSIKQTCLMSLFWNYLDRLGLLCASLHKLNKVTISKFLVLKYQIT